MTKREKQLQLLRRQIKRQEHNRELGIKLLVRATLDLPKLRKAEARLERVLLKRDNEIRRLSQLGPRKDEDERVTRRQLNAEVEAVATQVETEVKAFDAVSTQDDDLGIPGFLRRGMAAQKAADEAIAQAVKPEIYAAAKEVANNHNKIASPEAKKLVAQEKRKVKEEIRQAELTGQRRKMPLTGKDALAAIRGQR